ncbi:hypothetical protein Q1695_006928 [Nippostrongylus brasiliensis]|nr:hypothetical protein Q1695_006928 [Nippostrongylus brasiliensis]
MRKFSSPDIRNKWNSSVGDLLRKKDIVESKHLLFQQLSLFKVFALCHVSAMTSAALNPVIYPWFDPQFRGAIQSLCRGEQKRGKSKLHTEIHTKLVEGRTDMKIKLELNLDDCHQPGDQIL